MGASCAGRSDGASRAAPQQTAGPAANPNGIGPENLTPQAKVFDQFDTDKSGDLTVMELKRAISLGIKELVGGADEFLEKLDCNEDGVVNLQEWTHPANSAAKSAVERVLKKVALLTAGSSTIAATEPAKQMLHGSTRPLASTGGSILGGGLYERLEVDLENERFVKSTHRVQEQREHMIEEMRNEAEEMQNAVRIGEDRQMVTWEESSRPVVVQKKEDKDTMKSEAGEVLRKMCEKIFGNYDTDGRGQLDRDELATLLRDMIDKVIKITQEQIDRCMAEVDLDHNGEVDLDEFSIWYPTVVKTNTASTRNSILPKKRFV